jgi:membrane protein YqaA with SNARE-associated domain
MNEAGHRDQAGEHQKSWARRRLPPLLGLLLAAGITATLFIYRDSVEDLEALGYLGAFLISLIANGTIILPMPGLLLLFALGAALNPWAVGIVAGAGGALGEMTGYLAGRSGSGIWRKTKTYADAVGWVRKWGAWVVFLFTVTPLPVDVVGVAAGALRFPIWKFLLACWAGKAVLYSGMALAGAWGWDAVMNGDYDTSILWIACVAGLSVLVVLMLALVVERWLWNRRR